MIVSELFTRLLLATEHSLFDSGAEAVALAMAHRCGLALPTVFPLVSNPEFEALAPHIAAKSEQDAALKIAELRLQAVSMGVSVEIQVRRGEELYQEIVQEAIARASELIILRRRGKRSFLANLLLGEMVSKVVAHAPCHVLIVPRGGQFWTQRILVAAENTAQGRRICQTAMALASQCQLPLHLLTVVAADVLQEAAQPLHNQIQEMARNAGVVLETEIRIGKPFAEILATSERTTSDLIMMGCRDDTHLGRALVGGVAQKVLGLSEHPVLVLHS